jgi:tetratricopeptide (TPR) repeat protein
MRRVFCLAIAISVAGWAGCVELPPTAEELIEQAEEARIEEKHEEAYKLYKRVVKLDPSNAIGWLRVGTYATAFGTRTVALDAFAEALKLDPNLALAYYNRAALYHMYREWELALVDVSKAIELDPEYSSSYVLRGNILRNMGRYSEALVDFDLGVRLNPSDVEAYRLRGATRIELADWARAVADYDEAIRLDNSIPALFNSRSWANYELGRLGQAIDDGKEAIRLDEQREIYHHALALYYLSDGETRDPLLAVQHARRACELDGRKDWLYLLRLANALLAAGQLQEAKATIEETASLAPRDEKNVTKLREAIDDHLQRSIGARAARLWKQIGDHLQSPTK